MSANPAFEPTGLSAIDGVLPLGAMWHTDAPSETRTSRTEEEKALSAMTCSDEDVNNLFKAEYSRLLRYARFQLNDKDEAEQVVQEVFKNLYDRRSAVVRETAPAYLRRAVINRTKSTRMRRWTGRIRVDLATRAGWLPNEVTPDHPMDDRIAEAMDLRARIDRLPTKQRTVIVLRYYLDLPLLEIAEAMGISLGTVKSHMSRAQDSLRLAIQAEDGPA